MLVVSDSSPLIALINTGYLDLLPSLFGQVIIPPAVVSELGQPTRPPAVRAFIADPPPWLCVRRPKMVEVIPGLDAGELEAISLAREFLADHLLVDERKAFRAAIARGIKAVGTVRVFEYAAERKLIDLREAFDRLKQTDFWINHRLLDARLALFQRDS